jgi:hypothetical protein
MWKGWWGRTPRTKAEETGGGVAAPERRTAPRERTPEDEALLDRIARAVAKFGMTVPAVFMLESSKPLSFVGSQFLHFLSPIVHTVLNAQELDRLAVMLERRDTVEVLIQRIEDLEEEARKQ